MEDEKPHAGLGRRHQQCLVLFLCLTCAYSMRSCMGVALVAMTTPPHNDTSADGALHALMLTGPHPSFVWSKRVQDTIISAFFWGYMALQVPSGQLAHKLGAKYLIFTTMCTNAVICICFPWVTLYGGWRMTIVLRIVQGLSQACLFPSMHTFFGKWAPLQERGRLTALVYGGQALGTVLGLPITGFIASSRFGWPGIFRFYGLLSGMMGGLWWYIGAESPATHPLISPAERRYIESGLGLKEGQNKVNASVPWRKILTSRAMWGIVVAHIGHTWCQVILYTEVPAYMDKVMGVDIRTNGILTALPFLVMFFTNFLFSYLTDHIINKRYLSVTNTRKLANTIGCWPPAICFVLLAYSSDNVFVVETLLIIIGAFKIAGHFGFQVNHIDVAPNFAGAMMGISNFASNGVASFAPLAAGYILTDASSVHLWRRVFCLAAGFYFITNLLYLLLGSAEKASWNDASPSNELKEKESMLK